MEDWFYADYDQRAGKCDHTFCRYAFGGTCRNAASGKGRAFRKPNSGGSNDGLYGEHGAFVCGEHDLSFCLGIRARIKGIPQGGSHDDICADRRFVYAGLYDRAGRKGGLYASRGGMGDRGRGDVDQDAVDQLPQMVFFCDLYRHGMGMRIRIRTASSDAFDERFSLAFGRRDHLYRGRCDLCT